MRARYKFKIQSQIQSSDKIAKNFPEKLTAERKSVILGTPRIQGVRDTMPQFVRLLASLSLLPLASSPSLTTDIPERRWREREGEKE